MQSYVFPGTKPIFIKEMWQYGGKFARFQPQYASADYKMRSKTLFVICLLNQYLAMMSIGLGLSLRPPLKGRELLRGPQYI